MNNTKQMEMAESAIKAVSALSFNARMSLVASAAWDGLRSRTPEFCPPPADFEDRWTAFVAETCEGLLNTLDPSRRVKALEGVYGRVKVLRDQIADRRKEVREMEIDGFGNADWCCED